MHHMVVGDEVYRGVMIYPLPTLFAGQENTGQNLFYTSGEQFSSFISL